MFLPLDKGEAGIIYPSPMGGGKGVFQAASRTSVPQRGAAMQAPRGGGVVVIVAVRQLAVDGQVTSSGEPGWGCEGHWGPSGTHPQRSTEEGTTELRPREWRATRGLKALLRRLTRAPPRAGAAAAGGPPGLAAATCAAAGSGGSIVLVAETLTFSSPMRSGRVTAAGGGCLVAPPGRNGGPESLSVGPRSALQGAPESVAGECAGGGGGRIAVYADQPHPLDPVVGFRLHAVCQPLSSALLIMSTITLPPCCWCLQEPRRL